MLRCEYGSYSSRDSMALQSGGVARARARPVALTYFARYVAVNHEVVMKSWKPV